MQTPLIHIEKILYFQEIYVQLFKLFTILLENSLLSTNINLLSYSKIIIDIENYC